ncbi:putative glyoxalase/bleomycin resistance protein [Longispora fulva]|uniref:Putative enzyme related to lactoylglutathione lyase n=1 Tax=Longispora fulva TaxID=619741 RepID=A0A8J7GLX0_9ACTN|nr:VOC family protein [Longispora fulva]MBG6135449.1 putative enzyme related to lactoylglutathione lyase [Longispora fulva]GIG56308.1 putative glyoxalase/bleomycin resistance protein [Longispora fulva]
MADTFPPGAPNWADLGSTDVPGAVAFYTTLFGWTAEDMGPEAGGYHVLRLDGAQVGGLGPATDPTRGTSWVVYFATDDVDATSAKVASAGGTVVVEPMDVMDLGRMAVYTDPAGAYFSAWQPGTHRGWEATAVAGAVGWSELSTTDLDGVKPFYAAVLPVSLRDIGDDVTQMPYTLLEVGGQAVAGAMGSADGTSRWGVYFNVDDVDATADAAVAAGATELFRQDSPAGRMAGLVDPQGGVFSIITPDPDFRP